jgi:hypothetical protein
VSAASADVVMATPTAALNKVAPMRRRSVRARDSSLVAFMFLIFLVSSAVLRDAISDAQSLRAAETQSMKWLTELRYEVAMNHSFEFIVVNEIVCSVAIA